MISDESKRDFREEFTRQELDRLIERFICLYTREQAEEWKHSTDEMMAVLQEAQEANRLRGEVERLRKKAELADKVAENWSIELQACLGGDWLLCWKEANADV